MIDILGYEGFYSVTKDGGVYSHRRGIFMRPGTNSNGAYLSVVLTRDGVPKGVSVHRLVASAYIPNPYNKPQVNHIDGNKRNNHYSNLEWCTAKENVAHAYRIGLSSAHDSKTHFKSGFDSRRNSTNKLSNEQVKEMRLRWSNGETFRDISNDYPVDESSVRRCCKGQSYGDII